jgi:hypothetical protein
MLSYLLAPAFLLSGALQVRAGTPCGANPGSEFLPTDIGSRWTYQGEVTRETETIVIDSTAAVDSCLISVFHFVDSKWNQDLRQFWSAREDGAVLLWGAERPEFELRYDPPLVMLLYPPMLGVEWLCTTTVMGGEAPWKLTVRFWISDVDTVVVGGEEVVAYGVSEEAVINKRLGMRPMTVSGEFSEDPLRQGAARWWARGIGSVRYFSWDDFTLLRYDPTPVVRSSWGGLKRRFEREPREP